MKSGSKKKIGHSKIMIVTEKGSWIFLEIFDTYDIVFIPI